VYRKPAPVPSGQFRFVVGRHGQFTHASNQNSIYLLEAYGDNENTIWINSSVAAQEVLSMGIELKLRAKWENKY